MPISDSSKLEKRGLFESNEISKSPYTSIAQISVANLTRTVLLDGAFC